MMSNAVNGDTSVKSANDDGDVVTSDRSPKNFFLPAATRTPFLNFCANDNRAGVHLSPPMASATANSFTIHSLEARNTMIIGDGNGGATSVKRRRGSILAERSDNFSGAMNEKHFTHWIERTFEKRECIKFIPDENSDRCGCGRLSSAHSQLALSRFTTTVTRPSFVQFSKKWNIRDHTAASPTDTYGRIEFQGGTHAHKAHYLRLAFDSDPANVMHLMERVWNLQRPRLVITIHGGMTNFCVADKLGRLFREGMLKAAETTGAWILTSGVDSGVVRHVAKALDEAGISARMRSKVVTIGIAPWGLLRRRKKLIGRDAQIAYDCHAYVSRSRYAALNDRHSYFLLVDNGTVGRYGADIVFRKRFEEFLAERQTLHCGGTHRIPIVCLALEGGLYTLKCIHEYLTRRPAPIPVLICEGSGRVSDLLALAERNLDAKGEVPLEISEQLIEMIQVTLNYDSPFNKEIYDKIIDCARHRGLLTVFRLHEDSSNDVDHVILRALLTGQSLSIQEQLSLTLAWDRVDMARSEVLRDGGEWCMQALYDCMMDALLLNRVEFVKLLLENGLSLRKFLTFGRLERLYNSDAERLRTLYHLIGGHKTHRGVSDAEAGPAFRLPEIGAAIEKLMGNAYRCYYTTRGFKTRYDRYRGKDRLKRSSSIVGTLHLPTGSSSSIRRKRRIAKERKLEDVTTSASKEFDFRYPFNDLLLWAVLTRRHALAKCIWNYGEEAMAKALVAIRLYKCMSREAADDYTEVEVTNQLREYAEEFLERSLELLSHCYQQDDLMTMRLLTAELPNWGHHNCLSLAVIANNKRFLAHPCCQILLAELWHGGLRFRSQSNVKVILAILFPPSILLLDFKTFAQQKFTARAKRRGTITAGGFYDSDTTANEMDSEAGPNDDDADTEDDYDECTAERKPQSFVSRLASITKQRSSINTLLRRASFTFMHSGLPPTSASKRSVSCNESARFLPSTSCDIKTTAPKTVHQLPNEIHDDEYAEDEDGDDEYDDEFVAPALTEYSTGEARQTPRSDPELSSTMTFANVMPLSPSIISKRRTLASATTETQHSPPRSSIMFSAAAHGTPVDSKRVFILSNKNAPTGENYVSRSATDTKPNKISSGKFRVRKSGWRFRLLDCFSKFVLFYRAPITSFWIWAMSFCIFMLLFIYVLLIEFPVTVSWLEYGLFVYVLALAMEHFRKLLILESSSFMEKIRVFYNRYWNILTSIAILTYFVGFAFRFSRPVHNYSRTILASNSVLWHMKLFDYLGVHPRIGPYITMAGKMIISMSYIIVMLLVTLMAFGVVRQSITFPHEKWSWILVRNIFYKPYFMLYGEVYAGEIDTCGDEGTNCVPGSWIPPTVMVIFLLVANILLVNMLIAIFNNIFNVTNAMSQQVWLFQRYEQVLEYKSTPVVPPPLTPLVHIAKLITYICRSRMCRRRRRAASSSSSVDFAIKIYLSEHELKKLHDFEEDCMDDLSRRKTLHSTTRSQNQHIRECVEGVEEMSYQITELAAENAMLKMQVGELLLRFDILERRLEVPERGRNDEGSINQEASSYMERPKYLFKPVVGTKRNCALPRARVFPLISRRVNSSSSAEVSMPSIIAESEIRNALRTTGKRQSARLPEASEGTSEQSKENYGNMTLKEELANMLEITAGLRRTTDISENMTTSSVEQATSTSRPQQFENCRDTTAPPLSTATFLSAASSTTSTSSASSSTSSSNFPSTETLSKQ